MEILGLSFIIAVTLYASTPVSTELSVEDLEKIRQIVNESEVRLLKGSATRETWKILANTDRRRSCKQRYSLYR